MNQMEMMKPFHIISILVFESENEKEAFKKYVLKNWANKERFWENIWLPYFPQIEGYRMEGFKEQY